MMSVRHLILWKLKKEIPGEKKPEICARIKEGLEGLRGKIPGLLSLSVTWEGKLGSSSADLMLDSLFADEASLLAYRNNPAHLQVADTRVRPFVETRLCFDQETEK